MPKPVRCLRCGRENEPRLAFCRDCGRPLQPQAPAGPSTCASCGAALKPGFRFCGACGKPVDAPAPAPPASLGTSGQRTTHPGAPPLSSSASSPASAHFRVTAVRSDGLSGASIGLDRGEVVCGRTEGDLQLADDPTVSPRHARFTQAQGVLRVEDLGSVNGTFVRLKEPRRLAVGEEFRVGRQLLRLEPLPRPAHAGDRDVRPWGTADPGYRLRLSQLLEGGGLGEIFPLADGENLVGREAGEITFPSDRYVSGRHARIDVSGGQVTLTDVGSSNGTFAKISGPAELAPGDQLLVGTQLLRIDR
jgi:pSer/pThr/pTyr-binding forkhead associated (FHA) protein